jgi:enoyl-CoA hydratase
VSGVTAGAIKGGQETRDTMTSSLILLNRPEDGIGVITLNRPEKLNALSTLLLAEFSITLHRVEADPTIRAVIRA